MEPQSLKILMPSIIDPALHRGGAGTVTRGLLKVLRLHPLNARVEYAFPGHYQPFHKVRQFASIIRSFASPLPAKAIFSYSKRFLQSTVKKRLDDENFDLVLINGSDLLWTLAGLPSSIPKVLVAHNIEHQLYWSQINSMGLISALSCRLLRRDWQKLREYEMSGMERVKNIIFLSSDDAALALNTHRQLNTITVPPLFDYDPPPRGPKREGIGGIDIGFLCNFNWWPNRHGLRWFLKKVFPYIGDHTRLHLFGEQSDSGARNDRRIIKHGFIPRLEDVWPVIDFMICPIFLGGGVNIKFAEALYNGVPVLGSSFAARGLPLKSDAGIVLRDSPAEWISFLLSPEARTLRYQPVSASVSNAFAVGAHIEPIQTFIQEVVRTGGRQKEDKNCTAPNARMGLLPHK
jgi:glycosyltransferase involved in cell wall biosynthesis